MMGTYQRKIYDPYAQRNRYQNLKDRHQADIRSRSVLPSLSISASSKVLRDSSEESGTGNGNRARSELGMLPGVAVKSIERGWKTPEPAEPLHQRVFLKQKFPIRKHGPLLDRNREIQRLGQNLSQAKPLRPDYPSSDPSSWKAAASHADGRGDPQPRLGKAALTPPPGPPPLRGAIPARGPRPLPSPSFAGRGAHPQPGLAAKPAGRKTPRVRLRALAVAVARLLSCQQRAWRKQVADASVQAAFSTMRTLGGAFRLRNLPMSPLTTFADQGARNEISAIAPGVWQSNWRGAERVADLQALGIDHVISVLPRAEAGESPFPPSFRSGPPSPPESESRMLSPCRAPFGPRFPGRYPDGRLGPAQRHVHWAGT